MTTLNRRAFLGVTPFAVGAALKTFAVFNTSGASGRLTASLGAGGYGGLRAAKARNTGEEILTLPEGFEYNVIGKTGTKMSDGNLTPAAHDGMAAFKANGELRLARNHEINNGLGRDGAAFGDAAFAYDPKAGGGTTTLIIDPTIAGRRQFDLRTGQKAGESLDVNWVDIDEPDPPDADNSADAVYRQGFASGAATFARLEGCWYGGDSAYFTSTSGGDKRLGQVWQYTPQGKDKGRLKLIFESHEEAALDMPDNICVSPNGGLILCEDGNNEQYVRGLTRDGKIFDFAKNILPGYEGKEFAGGAFSPDGHTLFVNIQTPGMTLAIWGPWDRGAL
jgi:secreted PhoX family phosphatase